MQKKKIHERKLKKCRGFTLAETLLAIMILLMVSTIVATGIPAAKAAYEKVILASNAEVLLSTTISTLQNELGTAQDIDTPSGDSNTIITYLNPSRGIPSKIYVDGTNRIQFLRYFSADGLIDEDYSVPKQLITTQAETSDLLVTYDSAAYNKGTGILTISNLAVYLNSDTAKSSPLTQRDSLLIRPIIK